jgi:hypothetical protein
MRSATSIVPAILLASIACTTNAEEIASIRNFDIPTIERLGRDIYEQDLAAARASDILFAQHLNQKDFAVRGWVVSKNDGRFVVTFVSEVFSQPRGAFEVRPDETREKRFRILNQAELPADLVTQFRARQLASRNIDQPCSDRYNAVVLKEPDSDNYLVYLLAATLDPYRVLVGGHYRFTIDPSGSQIISKDKLFRTCLALSTKPDELPKDAVLQVLVMSHVVSDTPVETHVFLNLEHRIEFLVTTNDGSAWKINNGKIERDLEVSAGLASPRP